MTVVLHMSDPHFGTEQAPVAEALLRLAQARSPELVILSGDITQRARRSQFAAAKAFMDRLGIARRLVIPGNHDIPLFQLAARLFRPYARYSEVFGDELEPVVDTAELLVIGVKTTRRRRHIDGEISDRQIERVAKRLRAAGEAQLRIVVTHQPVYVVKEEDKDDLVHGRDRAIRDWSAAGADLILGGHIHRPYACALHEQIPGLARRIWAVQAGTALSSRIRHDVGNSVNLIQYDEPSAHGGSAQRRCTIERWDFSPAQSSFMLAQSQDADCDRSA